MIYFCNYADYQIINNYNNLANFPIAESVDQTKNIMSNVSGLMD